jgi:hypothetical protein
MRFSGKDFRRGAVQLALLDIMLRTPNTENLEILQSEAP